MEDYGQLTKEELINLLKLKEQEYKQSLSTLEISQYRLEQKNRDLLENLSDTVYEVTSNGTILFLSNSIERLMGYKRDDIIGENFLSIVHPDDLPLVKNTLTNLHDTDGDFIEFRCFSKSGSELWVKTSVKAIYEGKEVVGCRGTLNNINQRKLNELTIKEQNNRLRAIVDAIPDYIFISDRQGTYLEYETKSVELLYPAEKLIGVTVREVFDAETAELHIQKINECLDKMERISYEYSGLRKGETLHFKAHISPIDENRVLRFVRDITDLVKK